MVSDERLLRSAQAIDKLFGVAAWRQVKKVFMNALLTERDRRQSSRDRSAFHAHAGMRRVWIEPGWQDAGIASHSR